MAVSQLVFKIILLTSLLGFVFGNIKRGFYSESQTRQPQTTSHEPHRLYSKCLKEVMREHYPLPTKRIQKIKMQRRIRKCEELNKCQQFKICF